MTQLPASPSRREIAEQFAREQLAIMDGSFEVALKRIGTERYEKLVQDILKALPQRTP